MNRAYALLPIGIAVIAFYALSFVLSRLGIVSRVSHRKFWNVLLLFTFLLTGLIGLFLVVKINYKLEIPFYDKLLGYHVEFGIGMAIIGFFHFIWHLNYYLQLLKGNPKTEKLPKVEPLVNDAGPGFLKISAFMLGSTGMIAQVILLREFLTVFNGNELVVGMVLANWMILTGIGAWLGSLPLKMKKAFPVIFSGLLLLSALPFVLAFLISFLKNIVFPVGAMISLMQMFGASFLLLLPLCLISGFLFTFLARCYSDTSNQNQTGPVYGFESLGSIIGGLLTGVVFIFVFSSVESLLVMAVLNGLALLYISYRQNRKKLVWFPFTVIVPAAVLLFFNPEKEIRQYVFPNQQIVVSKDSPSGNIVVTQRENQVGVYNNNVLLFDSENFMTDEEAVHFSMLQHPNPQSVLVVSGNLTGQLTELRKYEPETIHYVEDNRWMLRIMKDSLENIADSRLQVLHSDPLRYLRETSKKYDVIILNLPAPSTLQANRFYTCEFFRLAKNRLAPGGVLSFGMPGSINYQSDETVGLYSTLVASLKTVFRNVIILPGEKNYFLASDAGLTYKIAEAVDSCGISNRYVNPYYFDDSLLESRGSAILSGLNPGAETNQNLKPVSYRQQLTYWLSYFPGRYGLIALVTGILALLVFFRGSNASRAMFLTGFSASGMEILLLFGLQVFFGNIYLLTSFVFAGFMAGLAAGSFFGKTIKNPSEKKSLARNQLLMGIFATLPCLLFVFSEKAEVAPGVVYATCLLLTTILGGLTGLQFSLAGALQKGTYAQVSGKTYSYDLFGSAFGALAVSLFMVPRWGAVSSMLIIGALNMILGFWLILRGRLFFRKK